MKPKESLLAVLLTLVFPGLGQIYAGFRNRGILFAAISIVITLLSCAVSAPFIRIIEQILFDPSTKLYSLPILSVALGFLFLIIFSWFVIIDSYRCAKAWNLRHNLQREITDAKKILLIGGIVLLFLFHPVARILELTMPRDVQEKLAILKQYKNNIKAFKMTAQSMQPTLIKGDRVLADKAIYKKSKPERGDVIVFKYPPDPNRRFLQRLIAFGGETVEIKEGHIYINGQPIADPKINGRYYYNRGDYGQAGKSVIVPEGNYYVLGDNSTSSHDSRYWGFVPEGNLIGKIYKIYWPMNRSGPVE